MKTGKAGIDLIKRFEGCKLEAYVCPAGKWTIGYGHTSEGVCHGLTISQEMADALLREDLEAREHTIERLVKVPLTQNQFDALVSWEFNTGGLERSTMRRKLNDGDYPGAAEEFDKWVYVGGRKCAGLVARRAAERALFENGSAG